MTLPEPRSRGQRRRDTEDRWRHDVDCWVATGGPAGVHLVPLSFLWHEGVLVLSTAASAVTVRNLVAQPRVRLGFGPTRDVVLVEGIVTVVETADLDAVIADAFAAHAGFEPRAASSRYVYLLVSPVLVQAWREVNELPARDLMREGRWLED